VNSSGLREVARRSVVAIAAAAALSVGPAAPVLAAPSDWPTYHYDATRSGNDPSTGTATALSAAWTSAVLNGQVYAEPLVVSGHVIVATEGDSVYSLDVATGTKQWQYDLGTPVPLSSLPCGNINPVGITGTPVVDMASNTVYAVGFIQPKVYQLVGLDLTTGAKKFGPLTIAPSGFDPNVQGERGALAFSAGRVIIPFGGWWGDCGSYRGRVVSVNTADGSSVAWATTATRAGAWAPSGTSVDASGNIYVATGNGDATGTPMDTESVIRFSPPLTRADSFTPTDWNTLNINDTDLGSIGPTVLAGGLIFQTGKEGIGYLLHANALGGTGGQAFNARVCSANADASFGGTAYADPYIYVPCSDGVKALKLTTGATPSFAQQWAGPNFFAGPPIVSGGIVWDVATMAGTLYGFDALTGTQKFSVSVSGLTHFATPAASAGRLFMPTGSQITTFYTTPPTPPAITGIAPTSGPNCGGTTVVVTGRQFSGATAVKFGTAAALKFTVDSDTQVTAVSPAGTGTVDVTVTAPNGTSATSAADQFTYTVPGTTPGPTIAKVTPNTSPLQGGLTVTVTGGCLAGTTAVMFGTTAGTTITNVSPNQVTAVNPAEAAGTVDVTVTTPAGTSVVSANDKFTYVDGYWLGATDGGVFTFGHAQFYGSTGSMTLNKPVVGMAATPDDGGYWLVASDGGIFTFGDAGFFGSTGSLALNKPVVGMAPTLDGKGYWLVASDGGIFTFGSAGFFGSTGSLALTKPVVGMAATPDGKGYWLVASDGGIFSFGTATFFGSMGGHPLTKPVVGIAATPDGKGYWMVASDGGIFTFGTAGFFGSMGGHPLTRPVVGIAATRDAKGYWMVASDGGIFTFGTAGFFGSTGGIALNKPIVGMAAS
jgi:IPT/TIG domain/PQQ-like domain